MGMLALGLANHFLTWDSRPISAPNHAPPVVSLARTPAIPSRPDDPFAPLGDVVARDHGIFVREGHSSSAAVWGGVVPLLLIAGAGYLALGSRSRGGR